MKLSGKSCVFPTSKEDLIGYSVFLFRVRRLAPSTIRQYLAALKTYHAVLDYPIENFRSTALKYVLKGYENQYKAWDVEGLNRRTFTYAHLQILAEALARAKLPHYDAQLYLTAATTAYFTSIRMGDILIDGHDSNSSRLLTWERVQSVEQDELILYFAHPKQATRENGQVCELFSFPDKLYCPVENLRKLAILQRSQGKTNEKAHVFVMTNGRTLTMRKMNDVLKKHLMPLLDSKLGQISCHSFRCGIPSLMSAHPDVFTTEETVIQGDWHSGGLSIKHNSLLFTYPHLNHYFSHLFSPRKRESKIYFHFLYFPFVLFCSNGFGFPNSIIFHTPPPPPPYQVERIDTPADIQMLTNFTPDTMVLVVKKHTKRLYEC